MKSRRNVLLLSFLLPALLAGGCVTYPTYQQAMATRRKHRARNRAAEKKAFLKLQTNRYVVAPGGLWLCPTEAAARAGAACPGGKHYLHNKDVPVLGHAPVNGLWRSFFFDRQGRHDGFLLASALKRKPDLTALHAFSRGLDQRYPKTERIPPKSLNLADLLTRPKAFMGRVLIGAIAETKVVNHDVDAHGVRFTMLVASRPGSLGSALVEFNLANKKYARQFQSGQTSLLCGPYYCDYFVVVARYTGHARDRVDRHGVVRRVPVFKVLELGDRYGIYEGR